MIIKRRLTLKKAYDSASTEKPKLAVIFVHGIATDSSSFTNAIKYLEGTRSLREVRFVAFDLLGSGKSTNNNKLNYDYKDQLTALNDAINKLKLKIPIVLVGHSMGALIATKYANTYKKTIAKLILISPPIYTEKDLDNPAFKAGMKLFVDAVSIKNRKILEEKSFKNSINKIVLNRKNYHNFVELKTPAVLIYGSLDKFIAPYNIPKILKENPKYLKAIKTEGRHGVSRDKYTKMVGILEEILNA